MRTILAPLALVATAMAQGVTQTITPPGATPEGCAASPNGKYELTVDAIEPGLARRAEPVTNTLLVTLENGVLKDRYNRVGYIASNRQFQFDGPPQAGALYTGGWSLCPNGSLALGPSQVFYRCLSSDFYNLYDQTLGSHCSKIHLVASQARPEVVNEVPSPAGTIGPAAPAPTTPASTTPAVIVPPATTTNANAPSAASSSASALSSTAASLASEASSASASISASAAPPPASAAGTGVLPSGVTVAPPANLSATGAGSSIHIGSTAASSMAVVFALVALVMV